MKNRIEIQIVAFLIGCMGLFSCSQADNDGILPENKLPETLPISVRAESMELPEGLQTTVYVFAKSSGDTDYTIKNIISLGTTTSRSHPYVDSEWENESYRFLFLASDNADESLTVVNAANTSLAINDSWLDIRFKANVENLSGDIYYDVVDMSSAQVKAEGSSIDGDLTRLVGQMAIDIYRVANGTPEDIKSTTVASVLDRVYKIEMEYAGLTNEIKFDANGDPEVVSTSEIINVTPIEPVQDEQLRVTIPEGDEFLSASAPATKGSVRIKGLYCLPSTQNIRLKATFHYYDTTPICGDSHATHTKDCFDNERKLVLNLPQQVDGELLSIRPNHYTVNNAGILYDRIIDVGVDGSVSFDVVWID